MYYRSFGIVAGIMLSASVQAEVTMFKLDLSTLPYGVQSVSPDYSTGKQAMYLDQVAVADIPNLGKALRIVKTKESFVDFFVSSSTILSSSDPLHASWRGRFLLDGPVTISLGGGHFEGIAALRAENGTLYLETDAGSKAIGAYKKGLYYTVNLTVRYADGFATPTATIRYDEMDYGAQGKVISKKIYGPVSVKFGTAFNAGANNYFTLMAYGEKSAFELGDVTIAYGLPILTKPKNLPKLPPQNLPKFPPQKLPFKH